MRSYQYLQDLFTNVFRYSIGIGGRFHVSAKGGLEINADQLGEVIKDLVFPPSPKKYPLVMMMPPRAIGNYTDKSGEWVKYQVVMFFLTTTHYANNQLKAPNPNTQTSTHTVLQDWHDMNRCAVNFLRVLERIQKSKNLINDQFRLVQVDKVINPVSFIGVDRVSGVRLDFSCSLFIGCTLEDYNETDLNSITIPVEDSHPEHKL